VVANPDPTAVAARFVREGSFAFFSEEDTADPEALAAEVVARGGTALLTRGYRGATMVSNAGSEPLAPVAAHPTDPTGAGDCFSTAFMVRLAETGNIQEACRFGLAAGALAVESHGVNGVPTRRQLEARLAEEAA